MKAMLRCCAVVLPCAFAPCGGKRDEQSELGGGGGWEKGMTRAMLPCVPKKKGQSIHADVLPVFLDGDHVNSARGDTRYPLNTRYPLDNTRNDKLHFFILMHKIINLFTDTAASAHS